MKHLLFALLIYPILGFGQQVISQTGQLKELERPPLNEGPLNQTYSVFEIDTLAPPSITFSIGYGYSYQMFGGVEHNVTAAPDSLVYPGFVDLVIQPNDSSIIKIWLRGTISIKSGKKSIVLVDSTKQIYPLLIETFEKERQQISDLSRKVWFYEERFGEIEGSLDEPCVSLKPPLRPARYCTPEKKPVKKNTYKKN